MVKAIHFPLEMANGVKVHTLEEFHKHFDLQKALGRYFNGKLIRWLADRRYDKQVMGIQQIDSKQAGFMDRLCEVLGVNIEFEGVLAK